MPRLLQVNASGAWKNVQTIRAGQSDGDADLANAKAAVVLLATTTDDAVSFRVIDRHSGQQDRVIAAWDRQRGWRQRPRETHAHPARPGARQSQRLDLLVRPAY